MLLGIAGRHGLGGGWCFGAGVLVFLAVVASLGTVWVFADARKRGLDGALWLTLMICSNALPPLISLCCRPDGPLARCPRCRGQVLVTLPRCPHCGYLPPRAAKGAAGDDRPAGGGGGA